MDGDGDAETYGRPQFTEDDVRRAATTTTKNGVAGSLEGGRPTSGAGSIAISVDGDADKDERNAVSPASIE